MAVTQRQQRDEHDDTQSDSAYYVYCQQCGFYPQKGDVAIGHTDESKADNVARLHRGEGHHTFVVPQRWIGDEIETRRKTA